MRLIPLAGSGMSPTIMTILELGINYLLRIVGPCLVSLLRRFRRRFPDLQLQITLATSLVGAVVYVFFTTVDVHLALLHNHSLCSTGRVHNRHTMDCKLRCPFHHCAVVRGQYLVQLLLVCPHEPRSGTTRKRCDASSRLMQCLKLISWCFSWRRLVSKLL